MSAWLGRAALATKAPSLHPTNSHRDNPGRPATGGSLLLYLGAVPGMRAVSSEASPITQSPVWLASPDACSQRVYWLGLALKRPQAACRSCSCTGGPKPVAVRAAAVRVVSGIAGWAAAPCMPPPAGPQPASLFQTDAGPSRRQHHLPWSIAVGQLQQPAPPRCPTRRMAAHLASCHSQEPPSAPKYAPLWITSCPPLPAARTARILWPAWQGRAGHDICHVGFVAD